MNKIWLGVILYVLLCGLFPRFLQASPRQPDEAALLAEIVPSNCHFSGHFSQQKKIQGVPVPLTSIGDFYYSCDLGLVWHTQTPFNEAILYVNSSNNFRADADGGLTQLTGTTRYIMSNFFVRLLKGDTSYFIDEFVVSQGERSKMVTLRPESEYIRKGLDAIVVSKTIDQTNEVSLNIEVLDATGQRTTVLINAIEHYDIDGKRAAYEQCEVHYSDTPWCQVLRSPHRY